MVNTLRRCHSTVRGLINRRAPISGFVNDLKVHTLGGVIAPGETVSFLGNFSVHPMSPGTSPNSTDAGSTNSPIAATDTGTSLSVTFLVAGVYPYFCQMHYAAGMAGVVLVQ